MRVVVHGVGRTFETDGGRWHLADLIDGKVAVETAVQRMFLVLVIVLEKKLVHQPFAYQMVERDVGVAGANDVVGG